GWRSNFSRPAGDAPALPESHLRRGHGRQGARRRRHSRRALLARISRRRALRLHFLRRRNGIPRRPPPRNRRRELPRNARALLSGAAARGRTTGAGAVAPGLAGRLATGRHCYFLWIHITPYQAASPGFTKSPCVRDGKTDFLPLAQVVWARSSV